jgi:hypothetical protein
MLWPVMGSPAMKAVVIFLTVLAAIKLGARDYLVRSSSEDVIVAAYRERAISACQKDPKTASLGISTASWTAPASMRLVIGKSGLAVYWWQVDHEMWNARYRNPYLFVTLGARPSTSFTSGGLRVFCEYDIVNSTASLHRL